MLGFSEENRSVDPGRCLIAVTGVFSTGGGIATVNRLVVRALIDDGWRIDLFALGEHEANIPNYAAKKINYRGFAGDKLAFSLALWRAQIIYHYSLVFCDHINVATALAPTRLVLNRPYVVWVHGNEVYPPNPSWEGKIGLSLAAKRLASSEFTRDKVLIQVPSKATANCDLALEPDRWGFSLPDNPPQWMKTTLGLTALDGQEHLLGEQLILHVGRMSSRQRYKGHEELLRAFPQIMIKNPNAQLVLAGTGDDYAYLKRLGNSFPLQIKQAIFMPGFVTDVDLAKLFNHCYLFAMPSQQEGFGIVYLEAMGLARPCIGGRIDAASCVIIDGETGLLVDDPKSHEEIAAKINWLLAHPEKAKRMGVSGYHLVRKRYLFPEFKKRFIKVLAD